IMDQDSEINMGIVSIRKDQWGQFLQMMVDSSDNFSTWEYWKLQMDETIMQMAAQGLEVVEVPIDLDAFDDWCTHHRLQRDGKSRARYASELLRNGGA
ncbi:MAG: hypothetical protein ABJN80_12730, partial [Luteolibacter sp.]